MKRSIDVVAEALGNTAAVSRQSYIAPAVVRAHLDGSIPPGIGDPETVADRPATRREELALVRLLEELEKRRAKPGTPPRHTARPRRASGR